MHTKIKVITAFEKDSSITVRLTPEYIGLLLARMSPEDTAKTFKSYVDESYFVKQDIWVAKRREIYGHIYNSPIKEDE